MDRKMSKEDTGKLKKLLENLKEIKVPEAARKTFFAKLDNIISQREKAPRLLGLKDKFLYGLSDIISGAGTVFSRPVPAYARVAVLAFLCVSVYLYMFLPQAPYVHNIKGTVKIFDANQNTWRFASNKQKLGKEDIIKTFGDGIADISLGNVYSMRLRRNTEIRVAKLPSRAIGRDIRFFVTKGKALVYYNSSRMIKRGEFSLETDEAIASAIGTDFMVQSLPEAGKTWVGVLEGSVRVTSAKISEEMSLSKATVFVKANYKTEVSRGGMPEIPARMLENEWLDLTELYSIGRKPQVALLISTRSSRTRELLSIVPLYISDEKPSILPERLKKAAKLFNDAVKAGRKEKHLESIRQFEELIRRYPNPKYDVQFLLFIGAYYEHIGEHMKAIDTFGEVLDRYPDSRLASIAQCAIGIIYEERLRNFKEAEKSYREVVSRYPESPEAEEALSGLKRLVNYAGE